MRQGSWGKRLRAHSLHVTSEKLSKLLYRKTGITGDTAHREGIDGIVSGIVRIR
jgi:plasmid maintenance system antidote protein VapI